MAETESNVSVSKNSISDGCAHASRCCHYDFAIERTAGEDRLDICVGRAILLESRRIHRENTQKISFSELILTYLVNNHYSICFD